MPDQDDKQALDVERERWPAMLRGALDAIVTIDHEGNVVEFNPAAEDLFGYAAPDAVGKGFADLIIPPDLRPAHRAGFARFLETREPRVLGKRLQLRAMHRNGHVFPAEVSIVQLEGLEPPVFTGFIRDLTELEKSQRNLQKTIADLKRSNEDLEHFAFAASHDLQEPLRVITLYASLLEDTYADRLDEEGAEIVRFASDAAHRMKGLVQGLLEYSRVATRGQPFACCSCADVVMAALADLEIPVRDSGAVVAFDGLPDIVADPTQLQRVFMNLIANAIKFRGERPPRIDISARDAGSHWELNVRDNGIGFDARQAERIFLMFQRLNERRHHEGMGIGLSLTRRIIERHGGRIWATAQPAQGASFTFTLPRQQLGMETTGSEGTR